MKRLIRASEDIFAMSNIRGKFIKVEKNVPFSFYYSPRNSSHGPRVKPAFNPDRISIDDAGVLKLCDDWKFTPGAKDKHYSNLDVRALKDFFIRYLVVFLLVWDKHIPDPELEDYFRGDISLSDFIADLDFYSDNSGALSNVSSVQELEAVCRERNLVNFYGN